jgi:hypothetical protein
MNDLDWKAWMLATNITILVIISILTISAVLFFKSPITVRTFDEESLQYQVNKIELELQALKEKARWIK